MGLAFALGAGLFVCCLAAGLGLGLVVAACGLAAGGFSFALPFLELSSGGGSEYFVAAFIRKLIF